MTSKFDTPVLWYFREGAANNHKYVILEMLETDTFIAMFLIGP